MQQCPHCGKDNPETDAYCYSCGHILPAALKGYKDTTRLEEVYEQLEPRRRWGTAYFDQRNRIEVSFRDSGDHVVLNIEDELVLGRVHDEPGVPLPDLDLSPYGALEKGVSRRHLTLMRDHDTIVVVDMGSANHTYLNGQRLIPHEPRILRDNDEVRLGHLVMRVAFV